MRKRFSLRTTLTTGPEPDWDPCRPAPDEPVRDCCRPAVVRAYREMREKSQPERFAYEAALTVYRWHHPEVPAPMAQQVVSGWVWTGTRH